MADIFLLTDKAAEFVDYIRGVTVEVVFDFIFIGLPGGLGNVSGLHVGTKFTARFAEWPAAESSLRYFCFCPDQKVLQVSGPSVHRTGGGR